MAAIRPSTDGLGLLIEAFDTHHQSGVPGELHQLPQPLPPLPQPPPGPPPETAAHEYYSAAAALPTSDGYENELQYYMADGVLPGMPQGWASGRMYGYSTGEGGGKKEKRGDSETRSVSTPLSLSQSHF